MRRSRANVRRRATGAPSYSRIFLFGPVLIVVAAFLIIFLLAQSPGNASPGGPGAEPTKPQGTKTDNSPTSEKWTVAKGLPAKVTRLAFSAADSARGYGVAFVNKQSQTVYTTTDRGASWSQAGSFSGPVGDYISTDPLDAQDVVVLSAYAPTPGAYTFQRSLDGGKTWSTQSTTLTTTGQISQVGWSDSTFLLGMQLDGQLQGSSAVIAFPKGQAAVHLDVNGKLNGQAIKHLRLLTGNKNKIVVWGDDGSIAQNITGLATTDKGKSWVAQPNSTPGGKLKPTASSDDGNALVATSADNQQIAVSTDGGATWTAQPSLSSAQNANVAVYVTARSKKAVVALDSGTYAVKNGKWTRITSKSAANLSDNGSANGARLWAYDAQGQVIWLDD
jgi:BNR/Asp-box repeat protein